jgi:protein-tyrosine phosphatase
MKGRTAEKYYTLHIGSKDVLANYIPTLSLKAEKLVKKAWPGPLTIVFKLSHADVEKQCNLLGTEVCENLYKDNSIGVRCPANIVASAVLSRANEHIIASSANLAAKSPAVEAAEVMKSFAGMVELVLDGGTCQYSKSSSVVKIGPDGLQMLREGVYIAEELKKMTELSFLFVCTGNTCRSPMAMGLFAMHLCGKLRCTLDELQWKGYKVVSAGTMGTKGWPAAPEAVDECMRRGIDISSHRSAALTTSLLKDADLVFVMSQVHRQRVLEMCPGLENEKVVLLAEKEIPDPIGQGQEVYFKCANMIEEAVKKRICEILK